MTEKYANGPPARQPDTKEHAKAIVIVLILGSLFGLGFFGWVYHILRDVLAVLGAIVVAALYGLWKYHKWQMGRRQPIPAPRQFTAAQYQQQLAAQHQAQLPTPIQLHLTDEQVRYLNGGR